MVDYRKRAERRRAFYEKMVGLYLNFLLVIVDEGLWGKEGNIAAFSVEELDSSPKNQNQI